MEGQGGGRLILTVDGRIIGYHLNYAVAHQGGVDPKHLVSPISVCGKLQQLNHPSGREFEPRLVHVQIL